MGCGGSTDESESTASQDDKGPFKLDAICDLRIYPQTPPIINNKNELIFLYSSKRGLRYLTFDLINKKISKKKTEIKCNDEDSFDIFNSVYTLNPKENKIHFIVNNKDIKTLNLNSNTITNTNISITTSNNNYAIIKYIESQNKTYIFGAENKENNEETDDYTFIPYSTVKSVMSEGKTKDSIQCFGQFARIITINNNIYILGGQKSSKDKERPSDDIWRYDLVGNNWIEPALHLSQPFASFGCINYQNQYLITFGGIVYITRGHEQKCVRQGNIRVLILCDQSKKSGLEKGRWYDCGKVKVNKKENAKEIGNGKLLFHAVYDGDDTVHLFSYSGYYYSMSVKRILNRLNSKDNNVCMAWNLAAEAGKMVTPTKAFGIVNLGPKFDSSDEEAEEVELEEEEQKVDKK